MIDGVSIRPLRRIPDERGTIMKMLEASDPEFRGFGEVYFSTVYPGVVKGWHRHPQTWVNYCVVHGMIKLVLVDLREASPTYRETSELFMGGQNYCLVQIPPGVWNGFKGVGTGVAMVCNVTDRTHADEVIERLHPHHNGVIAYDENGKDGA